MAMRTNTVRQGPELEALRRWLNGQDAALEEWLSGRVRPIRRRPRTLAMA